MTFRILIICDSEYGMIYLIFYVQILQLLFYDI